MKQENYEKLKQFIIADFKIKNELIDMRPPMESDAINLHVILKYSNSLYGSLRYIIRELKKMISPYDKDLFFVNKINELSKVWIKKFIGCKLDIDKLRDFYQYVVTDMHPELIESVKREFVGYKIFKNINDPLDKCKTINEMLHVLHAYVMNNDSILQSLNILNEKKINNGYSIVLYGEDSDIAKNIFDSFPNELDVGYTDIVSFGDIGKVIMMVRDRGHALTIEIDYDKDDILISYFIPKLCNIEMVNRLPGVIKVREDASNLSGTTGKFVSSKNNLLNDLFSFINCVPMDHDAVYDEDAGIKTNKFNH